MIFTCYMHVRYDLKHMYKMRGRKENVDLKEDIRILYHHTLTHCSLTLLLTPTLRTYIYVSLIARINIVELKYLLNCVECIFDKKY